MQFELPKDFGISKRAKSYFADPLWFAWYPVVASDASGSKRLVWLEDVRRQRHAKMVSDGYGGHCEGVYYAYYILPKL